jgi:hypothetical protein
VVEDAKAAIGISDSGGKQAFSTDVLRIELSGPNQPHLTMVDLPGLFRAGNREQSTEDANLVRSLVLSYMKRKRTIILAVVSAKNDFALQEVTQLARELDPRGMRTLGLITKPDTLDPGSDSEKAYIELAQNNDVHFRLGWHVLRNRDYVARNTSMIERDEVEKEFFSSGEWKRLPAAHLGIEALRERLTSVLAEQILSSHPQVVKDAEDGMQECQAAIQRMGPSRVSITEQRQYLVQASHQFSRLMKAATDGFYTEPFFGPSEEGYRKRLRAVVQNSLTGLATTMRLEGHTMEIVETASPTNPRQISRSNYITVVKAHMIRSRGCELPGTFNPAIIGELFREQCNPWKPLLERWSGSIIQSARYTVNTILEYIVDIKASQEITRRLTDPAINEIRALLNDKVQELLEPHLSGHPITYNHYLTENIQRQLTERRRKELEKCIKNFIDNHGAINTRDIGSLVGVLLSEKEADMDRYACSSAIDMMQAYYKVSRLPIRKDPF